MCSFHGEELVRIQQETKEDYLKIRTPVLHSHLQVTPPPKYSNKAVYQFGINERW